MDFYAVGAKKDIYHQSLGLVLKIIQEMLQPVILTSTWLDFELKERLLKLN